MSHHRIRLTSTNECGDLDRETHLTSGAEERETLTEIDCE